MSTDTNPPVGATVEGYPRKGIQVLRHDEKGEARWGFLLADEDGETPIESCFTDHAAITLAWRMQQRAEQAEAERDAQMRRAEEAEAAWTEEKQRNIKAEAELAKFRALAVEAKAAHDLPPDEKAEAEYSIRKRLAALATPNQEPTP